MDIEKLLAILQENKAVIVVQNLNIYLSQPAPQPQPLPQTVNPCDKPTDCVHDECAFWGKCKITSELEDFSHGN